MTAPSGDLSLWRRVNRGQPHDFTILTIREDTFEDSRDGGRHPRVIIDCPDWVNILALTAEDELVLVRQFRAGVNALPLELAGGLVDAGETPAAAAERELHEETGYVPGRFLPLGAFHPNV